MLPQPGGVDVVARIAGYEVVVGGVVQPPEAERRAEVISLGGVVEHDVEEDLESGAVEGVDHGLELGDLAAGPPGPHRSRVGVVGREVADGVVSPVVGEAPIRGGRTRGRSGGPGAARPRLRPSRPGE